jgi:hypothetical protein
MFHSPGHFPPPSIQAEVGGTDVGEEPISPAGRLLDLQTPGNDGSPRAQIAGQLGLE